jgi:hypothetical protein
MVKWDDRIQLFLLSYLTIFPFALLIVRRGGDVSPTIFSDQREREGEAQAEVEGTHLLFRSDKKKCPFFNRGRGGDVAGKACEKGRLQVALPLEGAT